MQLDDVDRRIVASLVDDARASYRAIGEAVGLSAPAVKRRVDRLLADGAIERFSAVVPPAALGWTVGAVIELFAVGPTAPARIRTALTKHPEVVEAYTVTGEADAIIHVRVRDTDHLEHVLERIRSEDFVSQTRSVVVLSRLIDRPLAVPSERG